MEMYFLLCQYHQHPKRGTIPFLTGHKKCKQRAALSKKESTQALSTFLLKSKSISITKPPKINQISEGAQAARCSLPSELRGKLRVPLSPGARLGRGAEAMPPPLLEAGPEVLRGAMAAGPARLGAPWQGLPRSVSEVKRIKGVKGAPAG